MCDSPATEFEKELAEAFGISVKMLRFYALRMIVEIDREKPITRVDQHRLYNRSNNGTIQRVFGQ